MKKTEVNKIPEKNHSGNKSQGVFQLMHSKHGYSSAEENVDSCHVNATPKNCTSLI